MTSGHARARIVALLYNLCNHTCADGATAFADRETQTFFHRDRVDQADGDADIVAGHDHFGTRWQFNRTGHIGGAEVELRAVALEERRSEERRVGKECRSR